MPLNARNTKDFYQVMIADQIESVILYKRGNDQLEGNVIEYKLFRCWWGPDTQKSGQPIEEDMATNHTIKLTIPLDQLKRVGINYLNVLDRFKDKKGRVWQPETRQSLNSELFENYITLDLIRVE